MIKLTTPIIVLSVKIEHLAKDTHGEWNILSSVMEQQLEWRRDKVQELCSKGYSQREIFQVLQVGLATVNRDISYLRLQRSKQKIEEKRYRHCHWLKSVIL
jgi:Trp operon repressor